MRNVQSCERSGSFGTGFRMMLGTRELFGHAKKSLMLMTLSAPTDLVVGASVAQLLPGFVRQLEPERGWAAACFNPPARYYRDVRDHTSPFGRCHLSSSTSLADCY